MAINWTESEHREYARLKQRYGYKRAGRKILLRKGVKSRRPRRNNTGLNFQMPRF